MTDGGTYDVRPDYEYNANKGTKRGADIIARSLEEYGAGRSILVDANGLTIAGAKTLEQAQEMGLPVQVIESDGRTLYAIKRTDLDVTTDHKARELGLADNRSSEVGLAWDAEVLSEFLDQNVDVGKFWFDEELAEALAGADDVTDHDDMTVDHTRVISEEEGLDHNPNYSEDTASIYDSSTVRQIQLIMTVEQYHDLLPKMREIMEEEGFTTNVQVMEHLMAFYRRETGKDESTY